MFDREKNDNLLGVIYIFLCVPPYNSNFRYFKIKPPVPRTSNLRDSTVLIKKNLFNVLIILR